jgi:hypothetical protein
VNPADPAVTREGEMDVKCGTGLFTVSVTSFEVPPPGLGFDTVTATTRPLAISFAEIAVLNCELL